MRVTIILVQRKINKFGFYEYLDRIYSILIFLNYCNKIIHIRIQKVNMHTNQQEKGRTSKIQLPKITTFLCQQTRLQNLQQQKIKQLSQAILILQDQIGKYEKGLQMIISQLELISYSKEKGTNLDHQGPVLDKLFWVLHRVRDIGRWGHELTDQVKQAKENPIVVEKYIQVFKQVQVPKPIQIIRQIQKPIFITKQIQRPVQIIRQVQKVVQVLKYIQKPIEVIKQVQKPVYITQQIQTPVYIQKFVQTPVYVQRIIQKLGECQVCKKMQNVELTDPATPTLIEI